MEKVSPYVVMGVFLFSGWAKIQDPLTFLKSLLALHFLTPGISVFAAFFLPWLEFVSGFSLLFRGFRRSCALVFIILLVVFSVVLVSARIQGEDFSCGCFGAGGSSTFWIGLLRNASLLFLCVHIFLTNRTSSQQSTNVARFFLRN